MHSSAVQRMGISAAERLYALHSPEASNASGESISPADPQARLLRWFFVTVTLKPCFHEGILTLISYTSYQLAFRGRRLRGLGGRLEVT